MTGRHRKRDGQGSHATLKVGNTLVTGHAQQIHFHTAVNIQPGDRRFLCVIQLRCSCVIQNEPDQAALRLVYNCPHGFIVQRYRSMTEHNGKRHRIVVGVFCGIYNDLDAVCGQVYPVNVHVQPT